MNSIPNLDMKPVTAVGKRMLAIQVVHGRKGTCPCRCCLGTATLGQVQDSEAALSKVDLDQARISLGFSTRGGSRTRLSTDKNKEP